MEIEEGNGEGPMMTEDEESLCHQKTDRWRCENPKVEGDVYCRIHARKRKKKAKRQPIRRKTEGEEIMKCEDDGEQGHGDEKVNDGDQVKVNGGEQVNGADQVEVNGGEQVNDCDQVMVNGGDQVEVNGGEQVNGIEVNGGEHVNDGDQVMVNGGEQVNGGDQVEVKNLTGEEVKKKGRKKLNADQKIAEENSKEASDEGRGLTRRRNAPRASASKPLSKPALKTPSVLVEGRINKRDRKYVEEISLNCHQCQRSDKGGVIRCTKCRVKLYCVPCSTRW